MSENEVLPRARRTIVPSGGQFVAGSYTNHAGVLGYKLYIPSSYHGQPLPLVVMLHGFGQDHRTALVGMTPSQAVAWLKRFIDAGVNHILLNPCYEHESQMETLAAKVVPLL